MGMLKIIEWKDNDSDTIVYKYDLRKDYITKGSMLVVRDSQVAIFADKGKMADVFLPGSYKLDTDNIPLLTKLMSWKYGFESPFKSDVYYVNTKLFPNFKWGTTNPIMIRDKDFGAVRVRAFGSYSFKVSDAYVFMQELSGTNSNYDTKRISDYLRAMVVSGISDVIGECGIPVLDMAGNLLELGEIVKKSLCDRFEKIGLSLEEFVFENFSLPEKLEQALDTQTELSMMRSNMDVYTAMAQADALKDAAKNPGGAGSFMGAGIGMGMGMNMGRAFNNMSSPISEATQDTELCSTCGHKVKKGSKFCPECGKPMGLLCPVCGKSVAKGSKFCPECGASMKVVCPACKAELAPGTKFCSECGQKI